MYVHDCDGTRDTSLQLRLDLLLLLHLFRAFPKNPPQQLATRRGRDQVHDFDTTGEVLERDFVVCDVLSSVISSCTDGSVVGVFTFMIDFLISLSWVGSRATRFTASGAKTTNAIGISPPYDQSVSKPIGTTACLLYSSGTPTTHVLFTSGCSSKQPSSSAGAT
jgi:hypothetical protein